MLEAIGLNVIAFEPDNLALTRALVPPDVTAPQMIIDIGRRNTDIVITMDGAPRLTRAIPTGTGAIVRSAAQNLSVDEKQAEQFVFKFGISTGQARRPGDTRLLSAPSTVLTNEIDKSIKFFQGRYTGVEN